MNQLPTRRRSISLIGLLALGGTFAISPAAMAQPRDRRDTVVRDTRDTRDLGEQARTVRYEELPREVRKTLDDERNNRDVLGIQHVNQNGKEFYRCTVSLKKGERSIRIQPGGRLLSVEDLAESDVASFREKGSADDYYRQRDSETASRQQYWDRLNERITATAKNPEKVNLEEIPARVQATFAREALGEKVDYVIRYRQDNDVIYQTNVPDGRNKVRMLQVTTDGTLLNAGEFTSGGRAADADARARTLDVADLPAGVRDRLDRDFPRARIPHVDVATRRGERVYNIEIDERTHERYLVINEQGKVLSEITGRDYTSDTRR